MRARTELEVALDRNGQRAGALLDSLLDGIITREVYATKDEELARERRVLELRRSEHETQDSALSSQVEALASIEASAHMKFENADHELRRRVLASVLCNLEVEDGHIGSYQWKGPLGFLERSPEGALIHEWWALEDLNL